MLSFFSSHSTLIAFGTLGLMLVLSIGIGILRKSGQPIVVTLSATRNLLVPTAALLYVAIFLLDLPLEASAVKIIQTLLGIEIIWILLSLFKVVLFTEASGDTWRSRVPGLLVDITRFALVLVGTALVVAEVWDKNLGGFLATLGVGSIVLGLALQDTLGSVMAGIALLFERPFYVGDWIRVVDIVGKVSEINWRSVRLVTRDNDSLIIPNSVLGKERIQNYSRPTEIHGVLLYVAFSYNDPPNKAKHILLQTALATRDVLVHPEPNIRTKSYGDFSIQYEVKFFITNFARLPEIESDFMTKVWYAARRNNLTIPFPIRTVYKTEVPAVPINDPFESIRKAIQAVPLFSTLTDEEIEALARDAAVQNFARGEDVVTQGDPGDAMYILVDGNATVTLQDVQGRQKEVSRLHRHDFFGEMALLSGEPRMATVTASEDVEMIVIYKEALGILLERRPDLAQELAHLAEERMKKLSALMGKAGEAGNLPVHLKDNSSAILTKIRHFFGL